MSWSPRASSLGYYIACDYRAALDKLVASGQMPAVPYVPAPYADLGTMIHYTLQQAMGCVFPNGHQGPPGPDTLINAATLFKDLNACAVAIAAATALAQANMPKKPGVWFAERAFKARKLQGHADFISADGEDLVDLKTTSRKPDHCRMKSEHFIQMCAYKYLCPTLRRGHVLYVDSLKAQWAMCIEIDFETEHMKEFMVQLEQQLKYLTSKRLDQNCFPHLGAHCSSGFCPYIGMCKDKLIPEAGIPVEHVTMRPTTTNPFALGATP